MTLKRAEEMVRDYNNQYGTEYQIRPSGGMYQLVHPHPRGTGITHIRSGSLRQCVDALPTIVTLKEEAPPEPLLPAGRTLSLSQMRNMTIDDLVALARSLNCELQVAFMPPGQTAPPPGTPVYACLTCGWAGHSKTGGGLTACPNCGKQFPRLIEKENP